MEIPIAPQLHKFSNPDHSGTKKKKITKVFQLSYIRQGKNRYSLKSASN